MSRAKIGQGRALSKPITWLLRDEFSDTRAAGSINGTMPTPGTGGARVVTDTESKFSTSADKLSFSGGKATPGFGNPAIWYSGLTRSPGRFLISSLRRTSNECFVGWDSDQSGSPSGNVFDFTANFQAFDSFSSNPLLASFSNSTDYAVALPLRSSGAFYFVKGGAFSEWTLLWVATLNSSATMYPTISSYNSVVDFYYIRIPVDLWIPAPLASDGFGSTFGTTDGLGHAEGVSGGIGAGGGNVAWTQQVGTWTVSSSKAAAATLSGGVAVATVPLSTKDVFAKVKVTRSAGSGGMVLRWTDANNHLYTEHDGTNAYLKQVLAGSTTTLITAAATYSAGAEIVADLSGVNGRLYWNNALVGTTSSINSGLTATAHGLRSTDTGGIQLDDLCIYAKGTGGEYNLLNRYVNL